MTATTLQPGQHFPPFTVGRLGGGELTIGTPTAGSNWTLLVIYRGLHCPLCTRHLIELNGAYDDLQSLGVDVIAVSADTSEKAAQQLHDIQPMFAVGHDLSIEQMQALGLYISAPRSQAETDRPFSEPGVFVVDQHGVLQIIDTSNAPFARPEVKTLVSGLQFIRNPDNNYPIRGSYSS